MAQFAWQDDEGVKITTCADGIDPQEEFAKLVRIGVIPAGTVPLHSPELPSDRSQRHKWRLKNGRIVVDPAVPDPPHPRQALLDAVDQASTVAQLKTVLREVLK